MTRPDKAGGASQGVKGKKDGKPGEKKDQPEKLPDTEVEAVPENINFPGEEERVMKLWERIDAFKTCLKQSAGKPRYSFYDGPPFATGLPHYGHILAGTIKDIATRYAHQSGFHVERRFGWDTHGLPVEYEVGNKLITMRLVECTDTNVVCVLI